MEYLSHQSNVMTITIITETDARNLALLNTALHVVVLLHQFVSQPVEMGLKPPLRHVMMGLEMTTKGVTQLALVL